ncbi:hypothetical protein MHYP_G00293660 [Metynnis hypsauchen]
MTSTQGEHLSEPDCSLAIHVQKCGHSQPAQLPPAVGTESCGQAATPRPPGVEGGLRSVCGGVRISFNPAQFPAGDRALKLQSDAGIIRVWNAERFIGHGKMLRQTIFPQLRRLWTISVQQSWRSPPMTLASHKVT